MGNIYDTIFAEDPKYNGASRYKLRIVLDWVKRNRFREVLDVGSGRGHYLKLFKENGIKAMGLEPSKYISDNLKEFKIVNDDILGFSEYGRNWEALICMDVLEHMEPTKIEENIKALSILSSHALLGIANHSDVWHGTQLHLIQQGLPWWKDKLSKSYTVVNLVFESDRFFIFEVETK
jgi:hypothetical protein